MLELCHHVIGALRARPAARGRSSRCRCLKPRP